MSVPRSHLAYIAGLFDADGTITGRIAKSDGCDCCGLKIAVINQDMDVLEWIRSLFPGTITSTGRGSYQVDGSDTIYGLVISAGYRIHFLQSIIPFLKLKRRQAYLAMAYQTSVTRGKKKETRMDLIRRIQHLNQNYKPDLFNMKSIGRGKCNLAYIAGFIDGDGCIEKPTSTSPTWVISAANKKREVLDWFCSILGGSVKERRIKSGPFYRWRVSNVLPLLFPYFRLKKNVCKARLALNMPSQTTH